jgi:hypothetical protein
MSQKYLLPCPCGKSLHVDASQAGSTIPCVCGKELEVPTLRGLRELAEVEVDEAGQRPAWSVAQGATFTAGLAVLVLGIGLVIYSYPRMRSVQQMAEVDEHKIYNEEVANLSPSELLDAWNEARQFGLVGRGQNPYVMSRKYRARMKAFALTGVGLMVVGGIVMVGAMVGRKT